MERHISKGSQKDVDDAIDHWHNKVGLRPDYWVSPTGQAVEYYVIPAEGLDGQIPSSDACIVEVSEETGDYFVGVFSGAPVALRGYYAWHEIVEWDLCEENGKGYPWCPYTDQYICGFIEDPDLLLEFHNRRVDFFDAMVVWGKAHPYIEGEKKSGYHPEDVEMFRQTAEWHKSQLP